MRENRVHQLPYMGEDVYISYHTWKKLGFSFISLVGRSFLSSTLSAAFKLLNTSYCKNSIDSEVRVEVRDYLNVL